MELGSVHCCAVAGGAFYCWGFNDFGQLGIGSVGGTQTRPVAVSLGGVVMVSAGDFHTYALLDDASLSCRGRDDAGQLGNGAPFQDASSPSPVSSLGAAVLVSAGREHTCALLADGNAACWGAYPFGRLGGGVTSSDAPAPTPVTWP